MYRLSTLRSLLSSPQFTRCKFTLDPKDLIIQNVIGSGPGGTRVARTRNQAVVKHVPTNIVVRCHKTRLLEENTRIAIKLLTDKVERHLYGEESSVAIKEERKRQKKKEKKLVSKEEAEKRIAANKVKRQLADSALKEEISRVMGAKLPYLQKSEQVQDIEKSDPDTAESDSLHSTDEMESKLEDSSRVEDSKIFQDNYHVQSQKSLNSLFGYPSKDK